MGVIMGVIHIICENPHLRFQRHEMMKLLLLKAHWITSFVTICLLSYGLTQLFIFFTVQHIGVVQDNRF
jgi:hypothetical protein